MEPFPYTIEITPLEKKGFSIAVPRLPGCVTWGETFGHAVAMAKEAIDLWLDEMSAEGERIPEPDHDPKPIKLVFASDAREWSQISELHSVSQIMAALKAEGLEEKRRSRRHLVLRNQKQRRTVTIPVDDRNIPVQTLKGVLKQSAVNSYRV